MIPSIPVSVWEQIAVVIVFAFLLAGVGYVLVKLFTKSIADINAHYSKLLTETNTQWQKYFDARSESSSMMAEKLTDRMDQITKILSGLVSDFESHDHMERKALERMEDRQRTSTK
jgi:hypothetical protein